MAFFLAFFLIRCKLVQLYLRFASQKKYEMAIIYRFRGDSPNEFELFTDSVPALNESGTAIIPDELHITEVRNITVFDVANGMDLVELEMTRRDLIDLAQDSGYEMIELDDQQLLSTLNNPPRIITYNPTRGGTGAALTSNIILTFSESVAKATETGPAVRLINLTTNVLTETFAFDSTAVTVSTATATVNPTASLTANNQYALLIDTGYFTNTGATEDHGGIHDRAFYIFNAPAS